MKKIIINCETGKSTIEEFTNDDLALMTADNIEAETKKIKQEQVEVAKIAAQAKLAALGLTADDLKALGL